jgi:hypothetical protein
VFTKEALLLVAQRPSRSARSAPVGAAPDENPSGLTPTGNVVSRNAADSNDADGIRVVAVAHDTRLERNTAGGN